MISNFSTNQVWERVPLAKIGRDLEIAPTEDAQ